MKNTLTNIDLQFHWVQPTMFMRHFKLYSQNGLIGDLRFEKASTAYGSWTETGSAAKSWMIKGGGLFKRGVFLRESGANNDLAVFQSNLVGEGWVEFLEGSKFQWKSRNFWQKEWGFLNEQKNLVLALKCPPWYRLKIETAVEVGAQWHDLDELPLLMLLGWYLRVQNFYASW
jgi:hypothetical protein